MNKFIATIVILGAIPFAMAQSNYPTETNTGVDNPTVTPPAKTDSYAYSDTNSLNSRPLSKGGFFVEPMLLTTQEDTSIKTSQLPIIRDDTSGSSNGIGLGVRVGGHLNEVLLLGLDARYSKAQINDSFYRQADAQSYSLAPALSLQTPYYGVRLLASYVVAGESDPNSGYQNVDLKFKEAAGWRVGAGLFIAAVSLNLEYQDITYNSTEIQSVGSLLVSKATTVDANNRGYTFSLSFPVEL